MSKPNDEELLVDLWEGIESQETEEETDEIEDTQEELEDVAEEEDSEDTDEKELEEILESDEDEEEEQTEVSDEEAEELPLVESIRQSLGYDIEGDFEDTEEGIQLLVERATEKATESSVEQYFSKYPEVKELKDYIELGGDPNDFLQTKFPEVDYTKVELSEDESQQEKIVRQELSQVRGMSNEEINAEIEDYKNGGILENKAKRSLTALKNKQQSDKDNLIKSQAEEKEEYLKQVENHWKNVETTLKEKTELKGVKIPSKDKDSFFEYLSKPVSEGKSQAMIKQEEADLETRLLIDYMFYKDLKFSDLITRAAKDHNAKTLRQKMTAAKTRRKAEERSPEYTEELETI